MLERQTIEVAGGSGRLIFEAAVISGPLGAAEQLPFPGLMVTAALKAVFIQHLMTPWELKELKTHIALVEKWLAETESEEFLAEVGLKTAEGEKK